MMENNCFSSRKDRIKLCFPPNTKAVLFEESDYFKSSYHRKIQGRRNVDYWTTDQATVMFIEVKVYCSTDNKNNPKSIHERISNEDPSQLAEKFLGSYEDFITIEKKKNECSGFLRFKENPTNRLKKDCLFLYATDSKETMNSMESLLGSLSTETSNELKQKLEAEGDKFIDIVDIKNMKDIQIMNPEQLSEKGFLTNYEILPNPE